MARSFDTGEARLAAAGTAALALALIVAFGTGMLPEASTPTDEVGAPASEAAVPGAAADRAAPTPTPTPERLAPAGPAVWNRAGALARRLRDGSPAEAGLAETLPAEIATELKRLTAGGRPAAPGAVALAARDGVVAVHEAAGHAVRYADAARTELPEGPKAAMARETIVDLASLTKLFTAVVVLQLVEEGAVGLDDPVADVLPRFAAGGKEGVTVRHLLTHTGGLPPGLPLWKIHDTAAARRDAALTVDLTAPPGAERVYSDLGFIALGELVEALTGRELDAAIAQRLTEPLGMDDTGFRPDPALQPRIAATEHQPWLGRGLVHGEVADPNAWALGGVAGHAGMFATAADLAVLAQTLLNGGRYDDVRILEPETVQRMMAEQPGAAGHAGQGLGFWRDRDPDSFMGALATPDTVGHTGYTGTSLMIEPHSDTVVVLLTNRLHPAVNGPDLDPHRQAVADAVARALP